MMSSKYFDLGDFFTFSCLEILIKYWFIVLARTDSSDISGYPQLALIC